jgi:hypothetical protein
MFENRSLSRIFGLKRDKVTGEWRKLHNAELYNFYSSPNIIRQINSRRMMWVGMWHAWERREKCTMFLWESLKEGDHSEDKDGDGRMGS